MKYIFLFCLMFLQGQNDITVKNAWIRPAPEKFNTALYCTILNHSDKADTLYKVSSDISDDIQMHETFVQGDMTGMRPVKNLVIAHDDSVVCKPGGYHVMIMNLKESAAVGTFKKVYFFFRAAGKIEVNASVTDQH